MYIVQWGELNALPTIRDGDKEFRELRIGAGTGDTGVTAAFSNPREQFIVARLGCLVSR